MKPKLSIKSKLLCLNEKHKQEEIKVICLNKDCKDSPFLCSACLTQYLHEGCKYNLITIKQLNKKDHWKMENWPTNPTDYNIKLKLNKYENLIELDQLIESVTEDLRKKVNKAIDDFRVNTKARYRLLIEKRDYDIEPLKQLFDAAYKVEIPYKIMEEVNSWKKNIYQATDALQQFRKDEQRSLAFKQLRLLEKQGKFPNIPDQSIADRAFKVILWQLQNLPLQVFGEKKVTNTLEFIHKRIQDQDGIYIGEIVDGKKHGSGKYIMKNGNVYQGQMFKNLMQGRGKYIWKNKNYYQGYFLNDKMNGNGKLTFSNGDIYEGQFVNNKACGEGKMINSAGGAYQGAFFNNLRQGKGKQYMKNGNVFEGQFFQGMWHGRGKLIFPDSRTQQGIWLQNQKQ